MAGLQTMVPLLSAASQGIGLVSNVTSNRQSENSQALALQQLQARQAEEERQQAQDAALSRAQISAQAQEAERQRRSALKRAVARQRARFGGSGVSSNGGSSEAVLLGLFEESDAERAQRERLDNLRFGAIDQNLEQQQSLNVLQREQLRERQKLNNLSSSGLNLFADGLDFVSSTSGAFGRIGR